MNKFFNSLYSIFKSSCVTFTIVVFGFYIMGNIMASTTQVLDLGNLFLLYLFSFWFAVSNLILTNKKLNVILRTALHFVSTVLGFFVIFVYLPGNLENSSSAFILTLAFAVLYIVVAAVAALVKKLIKKGETDSEEYDSVYSKAQKDQ